MARIVFILILFSLLTKALNSQSFNADSLLKIVESDASDSVKAEAYNNLAFGYRIDKQEQALVYIERAISLSYKSGCKSCQAYAYRIKSLLYYYKSDYSNSLEYSQKSKNWYSKLKNKKGQSDALNLIALIYSNQGYYDKSIPMNQECLALRSAINDSSGMAGSTNNIGNTFLQMEQFDSAMKYFNIAIEISERINNFNSLGMYYSNVANIYFKKNEPESAFPFLVKSLSIREKLQDIQQLANIHESFGEYYLRKKNFSEAVKSLEKSLKYALTTKISYEIESVSNKLSEAYAGKREYQKAYEMLLLRNEYRDSINQSNVSEMITGVEMKLKFEKEKAITQLENEKIALEKDRVLSQQKSIRNIFVIVSLAVVLIALLIFRNYRLKKKDNKILAEKNDILFRQNEEITAQRDEIETQRDEIAGQRNMVVLQKERIEGIHKELTDSINYAKKIQEAALPVSEQSRLVLGEHFILFKPRNIVSGDFYWFSKINQYLVVVVADCTGHGVPGAFMSMLGISFLNDIVRKQEITKASDVLNRLRDEVVSALRQKTLNEDPTAFGFNKVKDGMDMSVCVVDMETLICQWAGANNSLYILKAAAAAAVSSEFHLPTATAAKDLQKYQLFEFKGDSMPIAIHPKMNPFNNNSVQLNSGDQLYLFSDGYPDQFGGEKGKKFKYPQFRELILSLSNHSMSEQQIILEKTLGDWMNTGAKSYSQTDDITVLGFRIP